MRLVSRVGALLRTTGPRRLPHARNALAGVATAATLAHLAAVTLRPQDPSAVDLGTVAVMALVTVGLLRLPDAAAAGLCVLTHLLGVAVIVALDLASRDASVAAQVFLYLPVLSAATQLRVPGVVLVTVAAVAGEAAVVLVLLPAQQAWTDLVFVGTTLVVTAALLGRAGVLQDRLVAQLQRQAAVDPLTGLLTRRVLDEAATTAVTAAQQPAADGTALLVVDVDRFKQVNDAHGHLGGDAALRHIAGLVRVGCREHDVVARMGGDELAVLLPGCTYDTALHRAQTLVETTRATALRLDDGTVVPLSLSIGVAHAPDHAATARDLYAQADAALYVAKRSGRGRVGRVPYERATDPTCDVQR